MDPLVIAGIGMQNDLQRMNTISQNLANVATPGYKKQIAVTRSFDAFMQNAAISADASVGAIVLGNQYVAVDSSAGTLRKTGGNLDLAIDGDGYFEVQTERGLAYTRRGEMRMDNRGRLVNAQGLPVMGLAGDLLLNGTSPISVNAKGEVWQGDHIAGQIKIVRFANPSSLVSMGDGLFAQGAAELAGKGTAGMVRTGYQENSNVNSAHEMVQLTETMRHFEAMQKLIQAYDDLHEKTIRKLGDF